MLKKLILFLISIIDRGPLEGIKKSCALRITPCCDGEAYEGCHVQDGNGIPVTTCYCNTDLCNSSTSLTENFVIIGLFVAFHVLI